MKIILLFCVLLPLATAAENGASLTGIVKDAQGAAVAGARLTLFSRTSGDSQTTASSTAGDYRMENLAPGDYLLRVEARGFANYLDEISTWTRVTHARLALRSPLKASGRRSSSRRPAPRKHPTNYRRQRR